MRLFRALLVALICRSSAAADLTAEQWRQDLYVLARDLPRLHKNLFFQLPKAEFDRQVRELDDSLPKLSDIEIRGALMRLLASVGNAHTTIDAFRDTPNFPLAFEVFPEGIYTTAVPPDRDDLIAGRVVAINGMPIDEIRTRLMPYFPKENDVAALVQIPNLLRSAAALKSAGVIQDINKAEFTIERGGSSIRAELSSTLHVSLISFTGAIRRREADYTFEYLPGSETMYIQYNVCREMKNKPFQEFVADLMAAARTSSVAKYVVDLRFNGGGDSRVIEPLINALSAQRGARVYALVGRRTFSSGFMAAQELQRRCRAVLVGEAMGQRPNSYGDVRPIKLPNSGLTAFYCTQFFRLAAHGDPPVIEPDFRVEVKALDYFNRKDPVLDYVLSHR